MSNLIHLPNSNVYYQQYGYTEFIDFCLNTPRHTGNDKDSEQKYAKEEANPWAGTHTFEDAVNYAKYGWDAGIKELEQQLDLDGIKIEVENDIVGCAVDVGRFLSGLPDSMISFYDDTYRDKVPLTVYVNLVYSGMYNGKDAAAFSSKIIETVTHLNKSFNIKLVGVFAVNNTKKTLCMVNIKDTDESFVLNSLAFAFHPSFFRRFWFKWLETTPYWNYGYGSIPRDGGFGHGSHGDAMREVVGNFEQSLFLPSMGETINPQEILEKAIKERIEKQ